MAACRACGTSRLPMARPSSSTSTGMFPVKRSSRMATALSMLIWLGCGVAWRPKAEPR